MAQGVHWEWRGFGQVSQAFRSRFRSLEPYLSTHTLVDDYLWAPGLAVNVKLRREWGGGALKFKRRIGREGELEQWSERPEDVHPFPLDSSAWRALTSALGFASANIRRPADYPVDQAEALGLLSRSVPGLRVIRVVKTRSVRIWRDPPAEILVELVDIAEPRTVQSVGLECQLAAGHGQAGGDWEPQALRGAMTALGIDAERLTAMSYLDAIELWVRSDRSTDR